MGDADGNDAKGNAKMNAGGSKRRSRVIRLVRFSVQAIFLVVSAFSLVSIDLAWAIGIMAVSLLAGAWFCGWLCPFGTAQEWLGKLGKLLFRKRVRIPYRVERFLALLRYPLLALSFLGLAFTDFLSGPYRNFSGLLRGHTAYVGIASWCLLGAFLAASLILDRPFCRYFCLEGAGYGLLSLGRIFTIRRDAGRCSGCGACERACPSGVRIAAHGRVRHHACVNCLECLASCPARGCLTYGFFRTKGKEPDTTVLGEKA